MVPIAELRVLVLGALLSMLAIGCGARTASDGGGGDDQPMPDMPAPVEDLPAESNEYEGILYGINYDAEPTRFMACDTGELWHMSYATAIQDPIWKGSCRGVFNRVRGTLDRSVDPPVVIIEEILEARWCEPGDCVGDCLPVYDSCYQENEHYPCDPLAFNSSDECDNDTRCNPVRFYATEVAGWMETYCFGTLGDGQAGDPCEYPEEPWEIDTCDNGLRCWNAAGDVMQPGVCVPYCDLNGEDGPACDGTCVQCSGDDRGLCMQGCSGDACKVDAFC